MLNLKSQQFDQFADGALAAYRRELLGHCEDFAPELWRVAKEAGLRQFILTTTDEAMALGLQQRGPMRLFVELSLCLGQGFRTDPQHQALWPEGDDPATMPMPFAQQLHDRAGRYLEACVGPQQERLLPALRNLLSMSWDPGEPFVAWTRQRLQAVYPEKFEALGDDALQGLIQACDARAAEARITSARGRLLIVVLALAFGVNVLDNPLYPWVARRLLTDAPEGERVEQTLDALRLYVQHMIEHFEKGG